MRCDKRIQAALNAISPARSRYLDRNGNATLLRSEMRLGWHFCEEFDQLCTPGEQLDKEGCCAFCGFDKRKVPRGRGAREVVQQKLLEVLAKRAGIG